MTRTVPFAPGVFTWPADDPQLIGSRCDACGAVTFPTQAWCPRCGRGEMREHRLARRGTLWTWTTQEFLPKEPYAGGETRETFRPYGVGLVELGGEVRVEGRLTVSDPDELRFGMEMELVIVPFRVDEGEDGEEETQVVVYAFRPVSESAAEEGSSDA